MISSTAFPATKFSPRTVGATRLRRRRGLDSLTEGRHRPVTIVRGFAGSGKTTLVADWVTQWVEEESSRRAALWVSCDEGDQDPQVLWAAIMTALEEVTSFDVDVHSTRDPDRTPDNAAAAVVNALMEDSERRRVDELVLVLDEVERAGDAIATLAPLVERVPRDVRIIFTSRVEVPLPLQQLRVRRMVWELRQADLDLSFDESRAFIEIIERHATGDGASGSSVLDPDNGRTGSSLPLDDRVLRALHHVTEGWLAPYVLALADAGRRIDELIAIDRDTGGAGMSPQLDEFFGETFAAQSQTLQSFLLDIALLDNFTAADCRAIVDSHSGDELLRAAEARGLFVKAGSESGTYRLHNLFRRFLHVERGRRSARPDVELHRRAASWYGSEGLHGSAVRHHVAAGDVVSALRLIGVQMWNTGLACCVDQLKEWLTELDDDTVRGARSAEAAAIYGLALVAVGDVMRGKQWLRVVRGAGDEPIATRESDGQPSSQGAASGVDSKGVRQIVSLGWLAAAWRDGDVAAAVAHLRELRELRKHAVRWPSVLESLLAIEVSTWRGDTADARDVYESRGGGTGGSSVDEVFAASVVAYTAAVEGSLSSATSLAESALAGAAALDVSDCWPMDGARRALGVVAYEQGRFDDAREILSPLVRDAGIPSEILLSRAALARVELALGQVGTAMSTLRTPTGVPLVHDGSPLRDHLLSVDVRAALAVGDLARAHDLIDHARQPERQLMLRARVALVAGRLDEADAALGELTADAGTETPRAQVDLLVARARLARKQKDEARAEDWVAEAVERSMAETLVRPFFEDGPELWPTLRRVLASWPQQTFHDVALEMATRGRSQRRLQPESHETGSSPSMLESLRPREVEVLRLIGQRLSNAEIAAALFISPNTLKTHTRSLYRKIGVARRAEAVEVAERLHLY